MPRITHRLDDKEVRKRLTFCPDGEVTDEIYTFGQRLLDQAIENLRRIEAKAASVAAYSGGVITILVSSAAAWSRLGTPATSAVIGLSGLIALAAAVVSVCAMKTRPIECVSEDEWLDPECLSDINKLKRFRALTMWGSMSSHKNAHVDKARLVGRAQNLLGLSVALLLCALILIVWTHSIGTPFWGFVRQ